MKPSLSIKDCQSAFSKETLTSSFFKSSLYFFRDLSFAVSLFFLSWNTDSLLFLLPLWLLQSLVFLGLYQIGHDSAHGSLFSSKRFGYWVGQISFLPVLHPFHQWVFGHNEIHHVKTICFRGDLAWHPRRLEKYKRMNLIEKSFHRLYWSAFGPGFYYMIKMWLQGLILNPAPSFRAKRDIVFVLVFAVVSVSLILYFGGTSEAGFQWFTGLWYLTKVYLVPFVISHYLIGASVYIHHIHPEILWKEKEDWTPVYGQLFGTTTYPPLPIWDFFAHNLLLHAPHHIHPGIPFYNLPKAIQEMKDKFGDSFLVRKNPAKDYFVSTKRCKLIDETGNWCGYPQ